jgi:formate hydrogenlyase subunit 4
METEVNVMNILAWLPPVLALALAPLLPGVVNRTKAVIAGRNGQPLLQLYYDLWKLLRKGAVYSRTTTWVFRAGPVVGLAAVLVAAAIVPFGGWPTLMGFSGDLILFAYLLALMRFFTVIAALDTGSSFEGMGASREVQFSALAEPAFLLGLAAVARATGCLSLHGMISSVSVGLWTHLGAALALVAVVLLLVLLTESARIPVDDPNTHLELTMIHEAMVLDHSGPDLAFILYGAALKLWLLSALLVGLVIPIRSGNPWLDGAAVLAGMLGCGVMLGLIESSMARLRLLRVPQLLVGAGVLAALALVLVLR